MLQFFKFPLHELTHLHLVLLDPIHLSVKLGLLKLGVFLIALVLRLLIVLVLRLLIVPVFRPLHRRLEPSQPKLHPLDLRVAFLAFFPHKSLQLVWF